ncbi:hypothetical protein M758_12G034600 [Ceratodon purpureus]|nr:hypothetical protein M758_12G034600 [Ceratodon purpureus]
MDEQQELSLAVVNNPLKATPGRPMKDGKQILQLIEQQTPIVWCGGLGVQSHDVTICLVPNGFNWQTNEDTEHYREILAVLKVHSDRLSRCSKYFETCLTDRWSRQCSTFVLETVTDTDCYTDCFCRMYALPSHKDFKDVKHSLGLLKVASQIQFPELMDSVCLYLSSKAWSDTDEVMIRLYSACLDFPRKHAEDLMLRLGMDESKEDHHKQLCDMVERCIRTALGYDGNFQSHRALIKEMLPSSGPGSTPSADSKVTRDVITIVSRVAKDMLVNFGQEYDGTTFSSIPRFADKMLAICWILETLLAAKVAEEVVQCFVHLHAFPKILAIESPPPCRQPYYESDIRAHNERYKGQLDARNAAVPLVNLVLVVYREVAAGNLLLKTPGRVALLENWYSLLGQFLSKTDFDRASKDLFSTLPFKQQVELVKSRKDSNYEDYISTDSLVKLLKKEWPTTEVMNVISPHVASS